MGAAPGTRGASSFLLGQGARAQGLGETFTAVAEDVNGMGWNPASLATIRKPSVALAATYWLENTRFGYVTYAHPLPQAWPDSTLPRTDLSSPRGPLDNLPVTVALHALTFQTGAIPETTLNANQDAVIETGGTVSGSDYVVSVGGATTLEQQVHVGAAAKWIHQSLASDRANAFTGDLGLLTSLWRDPATGAVQAGGAIQIPITDLRFRSGGPKEKLPLIGRLGVAWQSRWLLVALDTIRPIDSGWRVHIGAEYTLPGPIALRVGYRAKDPDRPTVREDFKGVTFGVGLPAPLSIASGRLDYAFVPMGALGTTHHVTFTMTFQPERRSIPWYLQDR
ncbi:MAG: UPF0164 family protein [Elusimicrobia bacterium]|nr:UPF0164 family protein [Elusimicrobiota bacterium]